MFRFVNRVAKNLAGAKVGETALLAVAATIASLSHSFGGQPVGPASAPVIKDEPFAWVDDLWDLPVLYRNPDGGDLQEFRVTGMYHGFYADVESDQGDYSGWENRRWRIGTKTKFLDHWELRADIDISDDFDPFYRNMNDLYLIYKPRDDLRVKMGRTKALWGSQWRQSIKTFPYIEWGQLVSQLRPQRAVGIAVDGKWNHWIYEAAVWSGDLTREFTDFEGDAFYSGSIGYDFASKSEAFETLQWRLDFYFNETDEKGNAVKDYGQAYSNSLAIGRDRWELVADLMFATDRSPDVHGLILAGTYGITEKLELAARYQVSHGDDDSLRLERRYAGAVPGLSDGGRGSEYNSIYLGLNYRVNGDKLKLMTGLQYDHMEDEAGDGGDFDGWTLFSGLRFHF